MLDDRDRIFTNLYGLHSARLPAAEARGAWNDIKRLMENGPMGFVGRSRGRCCAGAEGAGFPTGLKWLLMPKRHALEAEGCSCIRFDLLIGLIK
jgi:NADH-quinone oxidoreductase subunit F